MPALLYRPSIRPSSAIVCSTYDATSSSTQTSAVISATRVSGAAARSASPALLSASPVDVDQREIGALLRQPQRRGQPEARTGPGHDHDLAFETSVHTLDYLLLS